MANVKSYLNNIKNAVFGSEVRGSIHDGIEAINEEVENTTSRQNVLENTFEELTINAGNSNAEIVAARVEADGTTHKKLGDRLNKVDSQIKDIDNKISYVTYEEFGALSNGVFNDGIAIKQAHDYANANNLAVKATNKEYYIKDVEEIIVKTNTNFNNAIFYIDDTIIDSTRNNGIFKISSKFESINIEDVSGITINKRTRKIPNLSGYGKCFVEVVNMNKKHFIRKGANADNGYYQRDHFVIDNNGIILNDIIWDFEQITNITLYPIDDDFLHIENGLFITNANHRETEYNYFERGIKVNRSNVIISNVNHKIENEFPGSPYAGFIHGENCANLFIKDCLLQSHKCFTNSQGTKMGTYDLRFDKVVNLRLDNVIDREFKNDNWGIFTSNYCKDVIIEKCELSRVDAHKGVHNIKIIDSKVGYQSIQLVGSGLCYIDNVKVFDADCIINLRPDYGSTWNGDIEIRNTTLYARDINYTPKIVNFSNDGTHDFGYVCYYPNILLYNVLIDDTNVQTDGSYTNMYLIYNAKSNTGDMNVDYKYPYCFKDYIKATNLRTVSGKGFTVFYESPINIFNKKEYFYEEVEKYSDNNKVLNIVCNYTIDIDNVELTNFSAGATYTTSNIFKLTTSVDGYNDDYLNNRNRLLPSINFKNCDNVYGYTNDCPLILNFNNCTINHLTNKYNSVRMKGSATNCVFVPKLASICTSINTNWGSFVFTDCYFDKIIIDGEQNTDIANISKAYSFINYFKTVGRRYIQAKVYMNNCRLYNEFDFNELDEHIKYCNFKFGNHSFEYYLSSYGFDGEKPRPTDCTVPVGFNYWITTTNKFVTWNGSDWV